MAVSTIEVAEHYGIEVNRHGKALCPFHNDRNPSFFVANDHYHCYGCGEHGDSIDLVSKLCNLSLLDAAKKLAADFGLMPGQPPSKEIQDAWKKKNEAHRLRVAEQQCFRYLNEYHKLLEHWMSAYAPRAPEDRHHDNFVEACHKLAPTEHYLNLLTHGDSYERTEVVQMMLTDGNLKRLQKHLKKRRKERSYE